MMIVRCWSCFGQKTILSLGGMRKTCTNCKGIGSIEQVGELEEINSVLTSVSEAVDDNETVTVDKVENQVSEKSGQRRRYRKRKFE